jgi:hypothetical protein
VLFRFGKEPGGAATLLIGLVGFREVELDECWAPAAFCLIILK